jgi:transcriptional regulator GlxA family with amidase domain
MTLPAKRRREVVVLAFDDFQVLDVTGPVEVFSQATRALEAKHRAGGYDVLLVAARAGRLPSSSGLSLHAEPLERAPASVDTLVVSGGRGVRGAVRNDALVDWVRRSARASRRVASVCTGAFLLAKAGLLDGKKATTHWDSCSALAAAYPRVRVEADRIFVKDGKIHTSAGVTAGIDLALALVAEDHGRALALEVARQMVVFLQRPGGQSQFSAQLAMQATDSEPLAELQAWIEEHPEGDLSVPSLARRAGMSARNFARRFAAEVGQTPARYVMAVRLTAARHRLEESSHGLARIASECGFGTTETLRRAFLDALGTTPSDYRQRFSTKGAA